MSLRTLYRLAGWSGLSSAAILVLNSARRAGLIPDDIAVTHVLAPLAEAFGLFLITGLFLAARRRAGALGAAGYVLNSLGMAGLLGVEFILNLVFPELSKDQIKELVDGLTGGVFKASSIVFLLGAIVLGAGLWRAGGIPRGAIAVYVLGAVPVALRGVLPAVTFPPGLLLMGAGVAWLAVTLVLHAARFAENETVRTV
ncbi:hypothetical protein Lfu02_44260 [Longispora fulva]|uniref:DUF4386 domain-containing protein n=1 Tax=Longispora fulva TaxID=619741 RepID=A0A8J7GI85_9ACTN|nr:hypothetical protein [Longispora fulva]MBG6136883.1 hypothetical protein [Longispora fulva]GIG60054.1 hypothetical protein Lfu02_44260 [Longispora fulva]